MIVVQRTRTVVVCMCVCESKAVRPDCFAEWPGGRIVVGSPLHLALVGSGKPKRGVICRFFPLFAFKKKYMTFIWYHLQLSLEVKKTRHPDSQSFTEVTDAAAVLRKLGRSDPHEGQ